MSFFNLPSGKTKKSIIINNFGGVDLYSSPETVNLYRSPNCLNMVRDKGGSLRKRMGYERLIPDSLGARINGGCTFMNVLYVHSGDKLYSIKNKEITLLKSGLSDEKSVFIMRSDKFYIISKGNVFVVSSQGECTSLWENAYVPTVIVSKAPNGGGVLYEDFNLLSSSFLEQFLSDGESTEYVLTKENISSVDFVSIRDENGDFVEVPKENYSVDLQNGKVIFSSPPPKPLVSGMDNVLIKVTKSDMGSENRETLFGCKVGIVFGADGRDDRLFLGGNELFPGMDFFSASEDFSYFPHMNYSKLSDKNIKGYSVFNGSLYTHFEGREDSLIIKRDGGENQTFLITDKFFAPSLTSHHTSRNLNGEGLFFTHKGVFAITVSDVTKEKVCEHRSVFLGDFFNSFTSQQQDDAHAVIFNDFYALAIGDKMAVLDGTKKSYFDGAPLCSFQYECYLFDNINARVLWTDGNRLYFGSENGLVYAFFTQKEKSISYLDDGVKVKCYFETADISCGTFYKKKTFVSISAKIGAFLNTGVKIYAKTRGKLYENPVLDSMGRGRYIEFSPMDFETVSFSSNKSEVTLFGKIRIRNTYSVSFRLENDKAEPFTIIAVGTEGEI